MPRLTDRFRRFATAHLRSVVERDVYLSLVLEPQRCWGVEELAESIRRDPFEVDITLRRFHDAGAVAACHAPRRYRWHPNMSYLWSATPGRENACPVCGMPITDAGVRRQPGSAATKFCSVRCMVMDSAAGVERAQ